MARYYFDVVNENGRIRDDEGLDLPTTDAMRKAVSRVSLTWRITRSATRTTLFSRSLYATTRIRSVYRHP